MQIITLGDVGGAQKVVLDILGGLNPVEFDVIVVCRPGYLIDQLKEQMPWVKVNPLETFCRRINPIKDIISFVKLIRLIKDQKPDIVHCHSSKAGIIGRLAAWVGKVPQIIFTVHGWSFYSSKGIQKHIFILLERIMQFFTTITICVSKNDEKEGLNLRIIRNKKSMVIHNGIEIDKKIRFFPKEKITSIITVGRLTIQKDPFLWLEIVEEIIKSAKADSIHFFWVGGGPLEQMVRSEIYRRKLTNHVTLTGQKSNVYEILSQGDIFLLTSKWEGLPIVVLEAIKCGLPVVSLNVGGISEIIDHNFTGFLVEDREAGKVAEVLLSVADNQELRKVVANAAYEKIKDNFSLKKMQIKYKSLYRN